MPTIPTPATSAPIRTAFRIIQKYVAPKRPNWPTTSPDKASNTIVTPTASARIHLSLPKYFESGKSHSGQKSPRGAVQINDQRFPSPPVGGGGASSTIRSLATRVPHPGHLTVDQTRLTRWLSRPISFSPLVFLSHRRCFGNVQLARPGSEVSSGPLDTTYATGHNEGR